MGLGPYAVATPNSGARCLARARATSRRKQSPVAIPRTLHAGLRSAVRRASANAAPTAAASCNLALALPEPLRRQPPGTDETPAALSDPVRRPPVPVHDVAAALLHFQPDLPAVLNDAAAQTLRTARRGIAASSCLRILPFCRCRAHPRRACPRQHRSCPLHGLSSLRASQARGRRPRHSYGGHLPSACVAQPCPYVCRHFRRGDSAVQVYATDKGWHGRSFKHASRRCRSRVCGDHRVTGRPQRI